MIVTLPVASSLGLAGIKLYMGASDEYLASHSHRRKMNYPFLEGCPVCLTARCAPRWKGYYVRTIQDISYGFRRLVIRHGRCPYRKINFSLLPDFLLPHLRLTRRSIEVIAAGFRGEGVSMQAAVDTCFNPWNERNRVPVSTAHFAVRRHAFEVWWAKTYEGRNVITIRKHRTKRLWNPKRSVSVLTGMCPCSTICSPKLNLQPRTRGPPAFIAPLHSLLLYRLPPRDE
jgi:hypothetical protein